MSKSRWLFIFALAAAPLFGWWSYGLFDIDEGFYASIAREMNRRGEWITPYYNGDPWYEKPILIYWVAKPMLFVFGDAIGPRVGSVVFTLGTYLLVAWFAARRFGTVEAVVSTLVLSSSLMVVAVARMMLTDPLVLFALSGALVTFWESLVSDPRWRLATAFMLALVVLAKGPAFLIIFAAIAAFTYWRERELRVTFKGYWLPGTALLLLLVASWYVPAYLQGGRGFVDEFLIKQNLGRFTGGGDEAHAVRLPGGAGGFLGSLVAGLPYYPLALLAGMFPWIFVIGRAWPRRSDREPAEAPLRRYLAAWALFVLGFFTISTAKLPHYILPCCAPLALLIGPTLARGWAANSYRGARWLAAWSAACFLIAQYGFSWFYAASGQAELHAIARWLRTQNGAYVAYRMPRQRGLPRVSGPLGIDEQSRPSLPFYLDAIVLEADTLAELGTANTPAWVLTRPNRIGPADVAALQAHGFTIELVDPPVEQQHYVVWLMRRSAGQPAQSSSAQGLRATM